MLEVVAADPFIAGTVYAGGSGNNLFKSTDGGRSWATIAADTSVRATVSSLAFDPLHAQSLYAGVYSTIARTQDGGATWGYGGPRHDVGVAGEPPKTPTGYSGARGRVRFFAGRPPSARPRR